MDAERLMISWLRDLSTCTEEEIRSRWKDPQKSVIDRLEKLANPQGGFEARVKGHNPIYFLAERVWFDNDPALLYAPLHKDILCKNVLDYALNPGEFRSLLILIQRYSYKSTFMHGVVPMWLLFRGKHLHNRDERIALVHHKEEMASRNLVRIKLKFTQHEWLKKNWAEFCKDEDFGTMKNFNAPCRVLSSYSSEPSVSSAGLGSRLTGSHFSWMFFDDIVTEEHIDSKTIRDDAFASYSASRFMLDMPGGREICSGTRYHPNDLWGKLLKANVEGQPIYKSVVISSISDSDDLSFPTRHTRKFLEDLRQEYISRNGNDDLWYLQMQNEPKVTRLIAADWSWMKHCTREDVPWQSWRVILVDPAWKGTENSGEGDCASIQVWACHRVGSLINYYLLDGVHSNELTEKAGIDHIFRLMRQYGISDVAPEEHGGKGFSSRLQNEGTSRGWFTNIITLKNIRKEKYGLSRIVGWLGTLQSGRIWLCKECDPDLKEVLEEQVREYPQVDHDDALDCAAYTQDPGITESYVPRFNEDMHSPPWQKEPEPMRRTRYCQL